MNYKGKLYGRVGKTYFPLLDTSEEVDNLKIKLNIADQIIKNIHLSPTMNGSVFSPKCGYKKWNDLFEQYFTIPEFKA